MNIYSRLAVSHFRDDTRDKGNAQQKQLVCDTIVGNRLYYGIATDNLAVRFGCGISVVGRLHICCQDASELRKLSHEGCCQFLSFCRQTGTFSVTSVILLAETESGLDLLPQQGVQTFHIHTNVVAQRLAVQCRITVKTRENNSAAQINNLGQYSSGGIRLTIFVLMEQPT